MRVLRIENLRNDSASRPGPERIGSLLVSHPHLVPKLRVSITVRIRYGSRDPHDQCVDFGRCFSYRTLFVWRCPGCSSCESLAFNVFRFLWALTATPLKVSETPRSMSCPRILVSLTRECTKQWAVVPNMTLAP